MTKINFKYRPPPELAPPHLRPPESAADAGVAPDPAVPAKVDRWWYESSWDLRRGLDVWDDDVTIPGELIDELFLKPPAQKK